MPSPFIAPSELFARCQVTMGAGLPCSQWHSGHCHTPVGVELVGIHPQTGLMVRVHPAPSAWVVKSLLLQLFTKRVERMALAQDSTFEAGEVVSEFIRETFANFDRH